MNPLKSFGNLHIGAPVILAIALEVAAVWFPKYHDKIEETQHALIGYGLLAAAQSSGKKPNGNGAAPTAPDDIKHS